MPRFAHTLILPTLASTLLVYACGGSDETATHDPRVAAASAQPDGETVAVAFTAADLEAFERGLRREIELVRDAQQRAASGTPEERGRASRSTPRAPMLRSAHA